MEPGKQLSRRDFMKLSGESLSALALHRLSGSDWRTAQAIAIAEIERETEPQVDLPPRTFLTGQPSWFLRRLKGVPNEVLEKYNGPQSTWSLPEWGGVFLVPSSYFGNTGGCDRAAREILSKRVVFRADTERNETTDEGWRAEEQRLIQSVLALATTKATDFFGRSRFKGFVRVSRPGKRDRENILQQPNRNDVAGLVAEGSRPGTLRISILTSLEEFANQTQGATKEQIVEEYIKLLKNLLTHEIGHVFLLGARLGSLDNHNIVFTAGISTNLVDLLGKSSEEVRAQSSVSDFERPEMLLWKAFKVRGLEFYAQLQEQLAEGYGQRMEYTDQEVGEVAESLFKQAKLDFTYDQLLEAYGKVPDEKKAISRPIEGYAYPVNKVSGDPHNPDGLVSWWEEIKSPAPAPFGTKNWANQPGQIFPDGNAYYTTYHFKGNGKIQDGPPESNSAAVASWMKGGSLSGGDILFPLGMIGVEMIRAVKKK